LSPISNDTNEHQISVKRTTNTATAQTNNTNTHPKNENKIKTTPPNFVLIVCRFVKLPWEENPDFFTDSLPPSSRNFVADLLQRSPEARKPIRTVLHSPIFTGDVQVTH
jgi:hypothetical protein